MTNASSYSIRFDIAAFPSTHPSPFGLRTPKGSSGSAGTYFAAPSACLAFTGHRAQRTLFYEAKGSHDDPLASHPQGETLDVFEFLARVLTQIPKPRQHGVHYMGAYSSRARAFRKRKNRPLQSLTGRQNPKADSEPKLSSKKRAALRKRWAQLIKLIRRVHQTDPLRCDCGGTYRVIAFITEHKVIRKILAHLEIRKSDSRSPP